MNLVDGIGYRFCGELHPKFSRREPSSLPRAKQLAALEARRTPDNKMLHMQQASVQAVRQSKA
jgi:hypothetical protein